MKSGLIFIALCAFSAAMVPRDRRALNSEELLRMQSSSTTTGKPPEICAPQTPCGWSTYKPGVRIIEFNITNSYCVCSTETVCQLSDDDSAVSVYVHRCRPPLEAEGDESAAAAAEEDAAES